MVKWIKRIVLGVLALVLFLVAFVVIAVHTHWGREQIRKRVEAALQDTFPGGAKIGAIEGSVFGNLVVRDVELATADGVPMVTIGKIELRLAWRPLLGKTARIERLIADEVTIAVSGAPISNEPASSDSSPSAWSIELPEIEVRNAHVVVSTMSQPMDLDGVNLTGSLMKRSGEPMEATAGTIAGTWRQRETKFDGSINSIRLADAIEVPSATFFLKRGLEKGRVSVDFRKVTTDVANPRGWFEIHGDIARLVPELDLPRDEEGKVDVNGTIDVAGNRVEVDMNIGTQPHITRLKGFATGDLAKRTGSAVFSVENLDTAPFTDKKFIASGDLFIAASYGRAREKGEAPIRAMIQARGNWANTPPGSATISLSGTRSLLDATIIATGAGDLKATGRAKVAIAGSRMELVESRVHVETANAPLVTGKRVPIEGKLFATLEGRGALLPSPSLTVRGSAGATGIVYDDLYADDARVTRIDAVIDPVRYGDAVLGNVHVDLSGAKQGGVPLGRANIDAFNCDRGSVLVGEPRTEVPNAVPGCANRIFATITADPAAAKGTRVFAHAVVTPGRHASDPLLDISLDDHRMTLVNGDTWTGRGGSIVVGRDDVVKVRGVTVARGGSSVGADVDYAIATSTLTVKGDIKGLPALAIDPTWNGIASGSIQLTKRGLRIDGKGTFKVVDLSLAPDVPTIQGDATVAIAGQKVTVDATAVTALYGGARVELDVAGPRDVTDVDAWRALDRKALTSATITAMRIDLLGAKLSTGGMVDGQIKLAGADTASGILRVGAVHTPLGDANGDVTFSPEGANIRAFTNAVIEGLGTAEVNAELALSARPFDPDAWRQLGRGVLNKLVATIDNVKITPVQLAALGLEGQPYSGTAGVQLNVVSGATTALLDFDLRGVQGGVIAQPIDMTVHAEAKSTGSKGQVKVLLPSKIKSSPIDDEKRLVLAQLDLDTPVTFNRWLYAPTSVGTATLRGKFEIPELSAPTLLAVLGRKDAASGKLVGKATISGTVGTPVGSGEIVASKIQAAPSKSLRPVRLLNELKLVASWGGAAGNATITASEEGGGSLHVTASGRPDQPASVNGSAKIEDFDLAPFAAFLPGEYAAAAGTMHAEVTVRGLDSRSGRVWGELHVEKASVPLHSLLGTIQGCPKRGGVCLATDRLWDGARADITLAASGEVTITASGYLNRGKVTLDATADREFTKVSIRSLLLDNVSPIHELEPVLNGIVVGTLTRHEGHWSGVATVQSNASVTISGKYGNVLLDEDAPDDLYFVDEGVPEDKYQVPAAAWLDVAVKFKDVTVKVTEFDVTAYISTKDSLRVAVGDTIGITGAIGIGQGSNAVIFNKYYVIEDGEDRIQFDGTLDPYLDIRMKHTFRGADGFDMYVTFGDRVSQTKPRFQASSSRFTEGQLFGFFLGGEPDSASADATKSVATGAGSSIFSSVVGRRLQKRLPIKLDVIKCDFTSTATAGSSCTVGKWFGPHAFVAYKPRLEARLNENRHEAQGQWYWSKQGNWLLEGTVGDHSIHGIDVLWSKRW